MAGDWDFSDLIPDFWKVSVPVADQWGNSVYVDNETVHCVVTSRTYRYGESANGRKEDTEVSIIDAVVVSEFGVHVGDCIQPVASVAPDDMFFVDSVSVTQDEYGVPVVYTVSATNERKLS